MCERNSKESLRDGCACVRECVHAPERVRVQSMRAWGNRAGRCADVGVLELEAQSQKIALRAQ